MNILATFRQFVHSLVTNRKSVPERPASNHELDHVAHQLETMNRSTEQDFLAIGARLMEFLQSAGNIASGIDMVVRSSTTVRSTNSDHDATASTALTQALERCRRLVAAATADRAHLLALRTGAVEVGRVFGGFRQAVASFHVVCTMTRIEAARLGGAGDELGELTDEVLALARRMQSHVEHVLDAASAVDRQVAHLTLSLRGTDRLLDRLALAIPNVLRSLEAFSAQQAAAVDLSMQLAQDSHAVSRSIMKAVTSIQFHDITRQQVEHIVVALRHLSGRTVASQALHLEATQLASAGDTFGSSVARLWHDLTSIAASVRSMAAKGQSLVTGQANDTSFFLELQHCTDAIAEAVASHRNAEAASRAAAHELTATLSTMHEAAANIRDLDIQLLRVALNASIRAAHLGPRGDTLAVLASTLQELATSAGQRSQQAAHALDAMHAAVTQLIAPHAAEDDATLTVNMRATMKSLEAASETAATRLHEIATSATVLGERIATARTSFHADRLFAETVTICLSQLHDLADQQPAEAPTEALETFTRHYTMQSERDIHAAVAHQAPLVAVGDDIELF